MPLLIPIALSPTDEPCRREEEDCCSRSKLLSSSEPSSLIIGPTYDIRRGARKPGSFRTGTSAIQWSGLGSDTHTMRFAKSMLGLSMQSCRRVSIGVSTRARAILTIQSCPLSKSFDLPPRGHGLQWTQDNKTSERRCCVASYATAHKQVLHRARMLYGFRV